MTRSIILLFGVVSYAIFFVTFLYLIAFLGNFQTQPLLLGWAPWLTDVVPHSRDFGNQPGPVGLAIVINLVLVLLFGLQHSIMARTGFKKWLQRSVPKSAERSVYVLFSSAFLVLLFWLWRPLGYEIWAAQSLLGQIIGWGVFGLGFALVLLSTFLINHFELFGLRQVWNQFLHRPTPALSFGTPIFYRIVRHPLYLGFLLAFWGGPTMTLGGLLFAGGMTAYILIAIQFEEKDLVRFHGGDYVQYREQVPMIIPVPGRGYRPKYSDK